MKTDLIIHLDIGGDQNLHELERHSVNLRGELGRLDGVESVQPLPLGDAPVGAKVFDPVSVAGILLSLEPGIDLIHNLVRLLEVWLHRGDHRSLTIHVGQSKFEMKGGSAKEEMELAERILRELQPECRLPRDEGERFGLLIASSEFQSESLRRLSAPPADVEALAGVLGRSEVGGFDIQTLVNKPKGEVELAIQSFFQERKRDDLVLLYFSGHGLKNDSNDLYFAMPDTKHRCLEATAVSSSFVRRMMQNCPARRQILLLDCCFSGAFPPGCACRADETIGSGQYFEVKGSAQAILTASDDMQYSFEGDEVAAQKVTPSVFTKIVVDGIASGEADTDLDGNVTIDDLHAYIVDELRARNSRQNPKKSCFGVTEDIILATNPVPNVALTKDLRSRIESEDVRIRLGAVHDLGNLACRSGSRRRSAAIKALERLTKDDSRTVSAAATRALADIQGAELSDDASVPVKANPKPAKRTVRSVASMLLTRARSEYEKLKPKQTLETEYERSIATKILMTDPPPHAKTWRAELVSSGWSKRIIRVYLSEDIHLIEFRLTSAAICPQVIKIDGLSAAQEGTVLTWQEKFDFHFADGDAKYLATIEAKPPMFPLKIRMFRVLVAGRLLYSE